MTPTPNPRIAALEKLLDGPRDGALLRFSLGQEYLKAGASSQAEKSFRAAVDRDPLFSAAWKALGRTLLADGRPVEALAAFEEGIRVAERRGDLQAVKEMQVFARRAARAEAA
jgi:tetratricopeptide (TPR) repeat protein